MKTTDGHEIFNCMPRITGTTNQLVKHMSYARRKHWDPAFMRLSQWKSYLEMLSVDVTSEYLSELRLPIDREYPQVMRLARACLEAFMFPSFGKPVEPGFTWGFPKYWPKYRESEGILSDEELRDFARRYHSLTDPYYYLVPYVYNDLCGWIGLEASDKLELWFDEYFRGPGHELMRIHFMLIKVLYNRPRCAIPPPLDERQWLLLKECYEFYYEKRRQLSARLEKIADALRFDRATPWEAVIETFPVDSYVCGKYFPRYIAFCLQYQNELNQLEELKLVLGSEAYEIFLQWAREEIEREDSEFY